MGRKKKKAGEMMPNVNVDDIEAKENLHAVQESWDVPSMGTKNWRAKKGNSGGKNDALVPEKPSSDSEVFALFADDDIALNSANNNSSIVEDEHKKKPSKSSVFSASSFNSIDSEDGNIGSCNEASRKKENDGKYNKQGSESMVEPSKKQNKGEKNSGRAAREDEDDVDKIIAELGQGPSIPKPTAPILLPEEKSRVPPEPVKPPNDIIVEEKSTQVEEKEGGGDESAASKKKKKKKEKEKEKKAAVVATAAAVEAKKEEKQEEKRSQSMSEICRRRWQGVKQQKRGKGERKRNS
ncbi:hypothetical protein MRB53_024915 [Persea americana]|uniref:Uncharacterized protein n=1 Tax=Persea americana TaxID=3435 RepID=A0ACC2LEM9_PERAE|nr:hypothetical protein MRB53_024915 [Persea americana]